MQRHPEWDLDRDFLTVNHGSYGAAPRAVLATQRAWQDRMERQPSRFMNTVYPGAIRQAANALAGFLNANGNDLVFVDNATTGCNAVLRSLTFRPGDEVLMLSHAYGAVRNAVRYVTEQQGARIVEAEVPFPDPTEDGLVASVIAALSLRCAPNGAITTWVEVPPGQWSVGPVAGRRFGWVTGRIEALRQTPLLAAERIDGP